MMVEQIETLIKTKYGGAKRDSLIPILQDLQNTFGYLSKESIVTVGRVLDIPTSKIYGVASFYNQFRFQAIGKFHIQVCRGTACHVKGSSAVLEAIKQELKVEAGQTTRDKLFTLEVVACIGACGLAPVMVINGEYFARLTVDKTREILQNFRREHGNAK